MNQGKGIFYAALAGVMWGLLAIALKITLSSYNLTPFTIVWFRFSTAFFLLALFLFFTQPSLFRVFIRPPLKLIGASICLGFNYYSYMRGLDYTTPSNAQVFSQLGPVLFAVTGIYLFREKVSWRHVMGFLIVLSGLSLFYWEQMGAMANQKGYVTGVIWVIASTVAWVFYALWQKELLRTYSAHQLNLFIYGVCGLLFSAGMRTEGFASLDSTGWLLVIFLGLNTLIAYGAIAVAFKFLESHRVSVIVALNPIVTFLAMHLLAAGGVALIVPEHLSTTTLLGAATALSGSIFVILFTRRKG